MKTMKRVIAFAAIAIAAFAATSCGGNAGTKNTTDKQATAAVEVDALLADAAKFTDKEVTVEGICTHICQHGGKKIFLMGTDDTQVIRIEAGEAIGAFDAGCVNNVVRATGRLVEDRIDEAYLAEWERSIADAAAQQHGTDEGGCTTEKQARGESQTASTAQRIADFRARIADRKAREGKEYLSFYHIEGDTYEILK